MTLVALVLTMQCPWTGLGRSGRMYCQLSPVHTSEDEETLVPELEKCNFISKLFDNKNIKYGFEN
jgi:hypothetical protein